MQILRHKMYTKNISHQINAFCNIEDFRHKRNVEDKYMKSQFGTSDINFDAWAWKLTRIHSKWDLYLNTKDLLTRTFLWKSNLYCDSDKVMMWSVSRIISVEKEKHSIRIRMRLSYVLKVWISSVVLKLSEGDILNW